MHKHIYFQILAWTTIEILDPMKNATLTIQTDEERYVVIDRDSEWDIQVNHYKDIEWENDLDGGWVVDMNDETIIDNLPEDILESDSKRINKYITDKAEFIYELCYTN